MLLGFHTLWLAPYGGRYRNAAVTIDRKHHAAHLWVDRFAVPCSPEEQVHHLLWVLSKLDEVVPIVHARFARRDDGAEVRRPDGRHQRAVRARRQSAARDPRESAARPASIAWIAEQTDWSNEEVAQMLRELAIEIVTRPIRRTTTTKTMTMTTIDRDAGDGRVTRRRGARCRDDDSGR